MEDNLIVKPENNLKNRPGLSVKKVLPTLFWFKKEPITIFIKKKAAVNSASYS